MKKLWWLVLMVPGLAMALGQQAGTQTPWPWPFAQIAATLPATATSWGPWVAPSSLSPTSMVLGCAGSTLAAGASVVSTAGANTYGLPQCAANGGKVEWEPASFWTTGLVWNTTTNTFVTLASIGYTTAVGGVAPPVTVTPPAAVAMGPPPLCLPAVRYPPAVDYGPIPSTVVTNKDYYAVYVCQLPTGYITYAYLGTLAQDAINILHAVTGSYTLSQATIDCTAACGAPTAAELAFMNSQIQTDRPRAVVAFNDASLTRAVYGTNPDGTLNPTPVAAAAVAVAAPCDETTRIATAPAYFSVGGQSNASPAAQAAASVLPAGSFAICVVSLPIGSN